MPASTNLLPALVDYRVPGLRDPNLNKLEAHHRDPDYPGLSDAARVSGQDFRHYPDAERRG